MTGPAIEVEAVSMRYPKPPSYRDIVLRPFHREHVQALEGVSLVVHPGELFGFLGPNGAGKTTLIKILTTLILPSSGSARVLGRDVARDPNEVKKKIGVVMSDERSFYFRLTGRQNLEFFATLHGIAGRAARKRIDELLEVLGITEKADERFSDYSSGTKQKLAIGRGLLPDPAVLFFDEPTRSLDPLSAAQIRSFIRHRLVEELKRTVFLTTHNLHEAEEISDRIGIINRGRVLATGSMAEIGARLRSREIYRFRFQGGGSDLLEAIRAVHGVFSAGPAGGGSARETAVEITLSDSDATVPEIVALLVARGAKVLECARRESTLTEVFSEVIRGDRGNGDAS